MNLYQTLGLEKGASDVEIKKAYRALAMQYHPDLNPSADATAKFTEIKNAYEILEDPYTKSRYDSLLDTADSGVSWNDVMADMGGHYESRQKGGRYNDPYFRKKANMSGARTSSWSARQAENQGPIEDGSKLEWKFRYTIVIYLIYKLIMFIAG